MSIQGLQTQAVKYTIDPMDTSPTAPGTAPSTEQGPQRRIRILFVDDEPAVLKMIEVALRPMAREWETHFVQSGKDALALMARAPFDVVVSDMRMSDMNGVELLNCVLRQYPRSVRIMLSGYVELEDAMSCVGVAHQFLQKPCKLTELRGCLRRVADLNSKLHHEGLRTLAASIPNLPSVPALYLQMLNAIQSPNSSAQRIAEIAAKDPAMSAKLLQLSNSAFFGYSHEVYSVTEAVQVLGVGTLQALALALPLFSAFDQCKCPSFPIERLWDHSAQTGALARQIASSHLGHAQLAEQAFAAGLLHDVGKLILADGLPDQCAAIMATARAKSRPLFQVEREVLRATHADTGAYLLALWSLPFPLVEAVAYHHEPRRLKAATFDLTCIVHVANFLQHEQSRQPDVVPTPLDMEYLKAAGVAQYLDEWREEIRANGVK
jgi:HD-like signal output (HDOD) protein